MREGVLVDDAAPRSVDQNRVFFHRCDLRGRDQVECFWCQWDVKADDITFAQNCFQIGPFDLAVQVVVREQVACKNARVREGPLHVSHDPRADASGSEDSDGA